MGFFFCFLVFFPTRPWQNSWREGKEGGRITLRRGGFHSQPWNPGLGGRARQKRVAEGWAGENGAGCASEPA